MLRASLQYHTCPCISRRAGWYLHEVIVLCFLLSWILVVCLISLFYLLCNPPLSKATLVVSAPLLTYKFLLLPLLKKKKKAQVDFFFYFFFFVKMWYITAKAQIQHVVLQHPVKQNLQVLYEFGTIYKAGQISTKPLLWLIWRTWWRDMNCNLCYSQQEHKMWLCQPVIIGRGNSGLTSY